MAFFDELGAKLTKTGQMTVQKANDLAEVTKLNMRTGELNKAIQEHYAKLGERYYALHAAGPEEDLAAICGLIDKANEELESIRLELQRIRQLKVCPACGAENPSDASFCSKCRSCPPSRRSRAPGSAPAAGRRSRRPPSSAPSAARSSLPWRPRRRTAERDPPDNPHFSEIEARQTKAPPKPMVLGALSCGPGYEKRIRYFFGVVPTRLENTWLK